MTTIAHLAAMTPAKGQPFTLETRPTPKPGPNDLLIAVKSVALNPADNIMRDQGLFIPADTYPTVIGFDMSGLVLEAGANVPPSFKPNTRIAAYSASAWKSCDPDYGPFQEFCLVPWQHAVPLPDESTISWNHAATLPVAVQVPLSAWDAMGIPRTEMGVPQEGAGTRELPGPQTGPAQTPVRKSEALLIWGASSSVGTMGVQTARVLRDDPTSSFGAVYATAGVANLEYVGQLGAERVFDYKDPRVVDLIFSAAQKDGLVVRFCFLATGLLGDCQAVLKRFRGEGITMATSSKIASAPPVPQDAEDVDGVETIFLMPSMVEEERLEQFRYWIGTWLRESLAKGLIKPSPKPSVVGKGLGAINGGLDKLFQGVSCTKLVVEIAE
ncbi:alcohol dehydrogenase [Penicillium manginii]|uniref:alcohol dehydrogenase n=1 Tax=Penicillium manginii TaxID=203109 RepID=UPI002546B1D1|nr:alcohol dehydrogenase [Penicillium manginii]KAJ5763959.1 alcohol dehydrogenase [Penicillium manginii]